MRVGSFDFRPALWPTLVTVVLLGILLSLGFWQLDRAEQKRALLDKYHADSRDAVIKISPRLESIEAIEYQLAEVSGQYDTRHQFLLDNRTHGGRAGYHVITPFMISNRQALLVNRGWIPIGAGRDVLPDVTVPTDRRRLLGKLKRVPEQVFMLGDEQVRTTWPYRIQHIDIQALEAELGYSLSPFLLLLDPDQADGYVRDWHPLKFGPEKNVGYAVQWFGLAAALLLIYLFVNTRKSEKT